jgi:hypothetical protein
MASDKVDHHSVGAIAQAMKYQARTGAGWDDLSAAARESIDQILSSIARTVSSGQGMHWDGIIAYASAAKPSTDDPNAVLPPQDPPMPLRAVYPPTSAQRAGMEAIERSMRDIPTRNSEP